MFVGIRIGGGRIVGSCAECGRVIYASDEYVRKCEILICEDCIEEQE